MAAAKDTLRCLILSAGLAMIVCGGALNSAQAALVPIVATPRDDDDDDKPKAPPPKPTYVRNYTTPPGYQTSKTVVSTVTTGGAAPQLVPIHGAMIPINGQAPAATAPSPPATNTQPANTSASSAPVNATTSATTSVAASSTSEKPINPAIMPYLNKAYAFMQRGRFDGAIAELSAAVRADASSVAARRYLAYAMLQMNEPLDAVQQLGLIAKMTKPTTFDYYSLGEAYYNLGDYRQAADNYSQALAINSSNEAAIGGKIKSLTMLGDYPAAAKLCVEGLHKARDAKSQAYFRQLYGLVASSKSSSQPSPAASSQQPSGSAQVGEWSTLQGTIP